MKLIHGIIIVVFMILVFSSVVSASSDTIWIESRVVEPGFNYSIAVYAELSKDYSGFDLPFEASSTDIIFDSITLEGSIVQDIKDLGVRIDGNRTAAIIFPSGFSEILPIQPPGGKLCEIYFHIDPFARSQVIEIDSSAYLDFAGPPAIYIEFAAWDMQGDFSPIEFRPGQIEVLSATDAEDDQKDSSLPEDFRLYQNYPNPFNPKTVIEYCLPGASEVHLEIVNIMGQHIATLENRYHEAGCYSAHFDASGLDSGVYFYTLTSNQAKISRKMILLK
ncbi:MAG: T9SS type A sorting domain-containing protein [candidate division Zixibacteria bacterium]|nr:T9SS type A sorting domain-containing protein [candidate division Zixibacteria bacterium]